MLCSPLRLWKWCVGTTALILCQTTQWSGKSQRRTNLNGFCFWTGSVPKGIIFCVKEEVHNFYHCTFFPLNASFASVPCAAVGCVSYNCLLAMGSTEGMTQWNRGWSFYQFSSQESRFPNNVTRTKYLLDSHLPIVVLIIWQKGMAAPTAPGAALARAMAHTALPSCWPLSTVTIQLSHHSHFLLEKGQRRLLGFFCLWHSSKTAMNSSIIALFISECRALMFIPFYNLDFL